LGVTSFFELSKIALVAWHNGHRVRLQNRWSRESRQGVKFLGLLYIAVLLSKLNILHCHFVYLRKINASKNIENLTLLLKLRKFPAEFYSFVL
jgi:hypothetical protein